MIEYLNPYKKYKTIYIPWSNKIPEHWNIERFSNIANPKSLLSEFDEELLSVFLNIGVVRYSETSQRQVHKPSEDMSKYQLVNIGDFVLNNQQAWRGSVGVSKYRGIVSPAYFVFEISENLNKKYANYLFRDSFCVDQYVLCSKGVGSIQRMLSFPKLKNVAVIIPPRTEQDQIVKFLDYKISKINKFIKEKKREIELLKELKQAEINRAVTKGLNPNVPMKNSGVDWLGEIPEHWEIRFLSQVCKEQTISNKTFKNQNLLSLSYGKIVNKDINTTEGLLPASFDTYQIVNNGNIILRLTDLQNDHKSLRTGLVTQTGIITSAYTCILPNSSIIPEYLHLLLHSFDVCKVFYGMGGGLRQSIGFKEIRRLLTLIPPIEEQKEILRKCKSVIGNIEKMISGIESEISLSQEYKNSLTSDAVTGKVDVRDVKIDEAFELETLDEVEAETEEVIEE